MEKRCLSERNIQGLERETKERAEALNLMKRWSTSCLSFMMIGQHAMELVKEQTAKTANELRLRNTTKSFNGLQKYTTHAEEVKEAPEQRVEINPSTHINKIYN